MQPHFERYIVVFNPQHVCWDVIDTTRNVGDPRAVVASFIGEYDAEMDAGYRNLEVAA